jgi:5-hydroxyisourate hydrolase
MNKQGGCYRVQIVIQVLDGTYGHAIAGMRTRLSRRRGDHWTVVASTETDHAGRIEGWDGQRLVPDLYRIVFDSDDYFSSLGINSAYPEVSIVFRASGEPDTRDIWVVIAPSAYSIYLGMSASENPVGHIAAFPWESNHEIG